MSPKVKRGAARVQRGCRFAVPPVVLLAAISASVRIWTYEPPKPSVSAAEFAKLEERVVSLDFMFRSKWDIEMEERVKIYAALARIEGKLEK